jgi:DNA-binding CsgD family transcriptional regulator
MHSSCHNEERAQPAADGNWTASAKHASLAGFARVIAQRLAAAVRDGDAGPLFALRRPAGDVVIDDVRYAIVAGETATVDMGPFAPGVAAAVLVLEPLDVVAEYPRPHILPAQTTRGGPLTRRERQVAGLLAYRHTNAEIAEQLGISEHTARNHVRHVLRKLGVRSRRDVAAELQAPAELVRSRNESRALRREYANSGRNV